ncbi:hypothetical protein QAD02_013618 [Eretmocerus hayati]|uniref:Uncharacterized protein n=1 Tax=Eretmocerus hayati TaxID=131215 RepID=A0ACC2P4T1_9HYME|nr:hypothetical protein QAD02_013618 [Eretmocerus hayati]
MQLPFQGAQYKMTTMQPICINENEKNLLSQWKGGKRTMIGTSNGMAVDSQQRELKKPSNNELMSAATLCTSSPNTIEDSENPGSAGIQECPSAKQYSCKFQIKRPMSCRRSSRSTIHESSSSSPTYSELTELASKSSLGQTLSSSKILRPKSPSTPAQPLLNRGSLLHYTFFEDDTSKLVARCSTSTPEPTSNDDQNERICDTVTLTLSIPCINSHDLIVDGTNKLGSGAYGTVFKSTWLGKYVAVEQIECHENGFNVHALREIAVHEKLRHENIVSLMAYCLHDSYCYFIMEYVDGVDLRTLLFTPKKVAEKGLIIDKISETYLIVQLIQAFTYSHAFDYTHRDIEPENIMVRKDWTLKLCDFGSSEPLSDLPDTLKSYAQSKDVGRLMCSPPKLQLHNANATAKSDVWSCACVISEIYAKQ